MPIEHKNSRRAGLVALALAALHSPSSSALAQAYPTRTITFIVPFPAGGPTDTIARVLSERMRQPLGQPVVVENVSGANGTIGVGRAARAPADGYTLSIGQVVTHVFNGATYTQYDIFKDFEPVSLLTDARFLIIAKNALPATDLKSFVAWLKANPGKASAASVGIGSMAHISGLYLQEKTGTTFEFVPYRGGAPSVQSIVSGETDFTITDLVSALPQVRAGKVKALAVAGPDRIASAPDIPTVEEGGVPGLHVSFWHGVWVPRGTPADIIAKLNAAIVEALADNMVRLRFSDLGQDIFPKERQTPAALAALQKSEADKWFPIIRAAGIKGP